MRLTYEKGEELGTFFNFGKICSWDRSKTYCCNPEYETYEEACSRAIEIWRGKNLKTFNPKYPPATIHCENCEYSNKELGMFSGNASDMVITRTLRGTIPVPLKGKKKIWLDNVNQKRLDAALKEISPDVEELFISGSPGLSDLSFLEKFEKLKKVCLWWNNKSTCLWDFSKTPDIEFLSLSDFNRLSDISQLHNAHKLRYLSISSETGIISSLYPLQALHNLEYLNFYSKLADRDIRVVIALPALKYFDCLINVLDMESFAMFEARRPDVAVNFFDGAQDNWDEEEKSNSFWLAGKGQGHVDSNGKAKYDKHHEKYAAMKAKYLSEDYVPVIKILPSNNSPIAGWRQAIEEGIDLHTQAEIDEIEKIFTDYTNRMAACSSKGQAKNVLKDTIKKITEFNERTQFIETEERQEIYDYLSGFFKEKWYDEFEELLSETDW